MLPCEHAALCASPTLVGSTSLMYGCAVHLMCANACALLTPMGCLPLVYAALGPCTCRPVAHRLPGVPLLNPYSLTMANHVQVHSNAN
jgi:hypothetical protein